MTKAINEGDSPLEEKARTAIILGAGASAADGAPLQRDLFRGFFAGQKYRSARSIGGTREGWLQAYFATIWGIDVDAPVVTDQAFPTFEEALGIIEIAEARGESFRGQQPARNGPTSREIRAELISLIAIRLAELQKYSPLANHAVLVQNLVDSDSLLNTPFISLNYDIIIDQCLFYRGGMKYRSPQPDYGIQFRRSLGDTRSFWPTVPLLKLHGSLNWLQCQTCNAADLHKFDYSGSHAASGLTSAACPICGDQRVPILIPPTFFKDTSSLSLQQVWKRADDELTAAETLIFCGYSFPEADLHFKYLLKRSEVNRNGKQMRVFIVNEHDGKSEQSRQEEFARYRRFFKRWNPVTWLNAGFEQFAANPKIVEDHKFWNPRFK